MKARTLENYKEMFKDTDKEKLIEMNYELSKKLCAIEEDIKIAKEDIKNGIDSQALLFDFLFNLDMDLGGIE